ncbi:MAG: site-specific integrase, partial [Nannocystaceae bacterium]
MKTKRSAQAFERELLEALAREEQEARANNEQREKPPTLSEMWSEFIAFQASSANKRPNRPRTILEAERMWEAYLEPLLGDQRVDQITARAIDRLTTKLQAGEVSRRPLSHNSVANILGLLRRMLNVAKRWGYLDTVPEICTLKKKPQRLEDDKWLTQEETTALLDATEPEWAPVAILAVRTGMRVGELQGLRWGDVDLDGERLVVQRSWSDRLQEAGPPKGGRPREVPLTWDAVAALRPIRGKRGDGAFVFGDAHYPFQQDELRRALGRARRKSGLTKHLHIHMLRHTWASHCIVQGVHSRVVMLWGGWTSEAMLARYAHLAPREVESLINRIAPPRAALRIVPAVPKTWAPDGHRGG